MSRRKRSTGFPFKKYLFRTLIVGTPLLLISYLVFLFVQNLDDISASTRETIAELSIKTGMTVDNIVVEGRYMTDEKSLIETLNIPKDTSIFLIDLDHLSEIIYTQVPWVVESRVERHFPNSIHIALKEITPVARWQTNNRFFIISEEKTVAVPNFIGFEKLPLLSGAGADTGAVALMRLLKSEPLVAERLKGAERIGNRRWNLILKDDVKIMLPDTDEGLALSRLSKMHQEKNVLDKNISHIDMRLRDRLFIQKEAPVPSEKK